MQLSKKSYLLLDRIKKGSGGWQVVQQAPSIVITRRGRILPLLGSRPASEEKKKIAGMIVATALSGLNQPSF